MRDSLVRSLRTLHSRRAPIARELATVAFFAAASVLMTWPLALHMGTAVIGPGDPYVSASILDWDLHALTHRPLSLFDLPWFYPSHDALAFTEHLFGIALVVLPFRLLGASAIALHSWAMILGFAFCGYGASVLGRMTTRSTAAGLVAGVFYAFVPYRFHHLTHISYVWSGWLPVLLAALLWYAARPSWRRASLFGAAFFLNGITCLHWLAFGSVAIVLAAILIAAARGTFLDRAWWGRLAAATAVASIALLPWIVPYRTVARIYGMQRGWAETKPYSARWTDWFLAPRENRLYGQLIPDEAYEGEHPLFPGFVVLMLVGTALVLTRREDFAPVVEDRAGSESAHAGSDRRLEIVLRAIDVAGIAFLAIALYTRIGGSIHWRVGSMSVTDIDRPAIPFTFAIALFAIRLWIRLPRRFGDRSLADAVRASRFPTAGWCALLWVVLGVPGSFGLDGFLHEAFFRLLPPMRGIRVPLRWSMIAYAGLAAVAAIGMLPLLRARSRAWRWGATAAVITAMLFEFRAAPIHWHIGPDRFPPVYTWMSHAAFAGGVIELPIDEHTADYDYLLAQTAHHRPLLNGISSYVPARYAELTALAHADPIDARFVDALEALRCSVVVVHVDDLYERRPAVRAWLKAELGNGRLSFVRRFDHKLFGDYVFAVTRNWPDSGSSREPEHADGSGTAPSQSLATFLDRDVFTYNRDTFGALGVPAPGQDARGALTVFGWAMSPHGVREVNLVFDDGRVRVPAALSEAKSISRQMPWYPETVRPAFSAIVPVPRLLDRRTDLQVEIVDGRGAVTRLDDTAFRWSRKRGLEPKEWNTDALDGLASRTGMDPAVARAAILQRHMTIHDVADRIVADSQERSDAEFIDRAFRVLLDRPPDPIAMQSWIEKRARGAWRRDVVDSILASDEFERTYLIGGAKMEVR